MFGIAPARFLALLIVILPASEIFASNAAIRFDLPQTIAAEPADGDSTVECRFKISSLVASPETPRIDQWIVICQPRDSNLAIVDYFPKTNTASDLEGPIQIKTTHEKSQALGLSLDSQYGHIAQGKLGADHGSKHVDSKQYAVPAQVRAITASGTINRGRGVYFKWKRSANQVLEGEKEFRLILQVPPQWRGSLINVSVVAQREQRTFAGLDTQIKTLGQAEFTVAAYRHGDVEAARISRQLADSEHALRQHAARQIKQPSSLSTILRQVAVKLDLESADKDNEWVRRLLAGDADPHLDEAIRAQPMNVRLAVLDYCEIRDDFGRLSGAPNSRANRLAAHRLAANRTSRQDNVD